MLSMVLWYDTWDRENGGIIMRRDRVLSGGVYALKAVWDDLYALNPPAVFLLLGSLCTVFLYAWGSSKIALVMLFCTAFSYLVGRCIRGWGRVLLGSVFLLFMVVITLASILIGFLLCFDFSPNGRENYAQIRRDFLQKKFRQPPMIYKFGAVWGPGIDGMNHIFPIVIQRKIFVPMR